MSEVGTVLRKLRVDAGLTQEALAEQIDVTHTYVSDIERGKYTPSWRYLISFAKVVGANIVTLLRAAGFIGPDLLELEQEIAAMIDAYPDLAIAFDHARDDKRLLAEMARYARLLIMEKEREDAEEQGAGTSEGTT